MKRNAKVIHLRLTKKQIEEILFGLDVNRDIYGQNPGRSHLVRYCDSIRESIYRQVEKSEGK